ncbi:MAG: efflux RND transporter periplasmic adaptor subunit [Verrucomicrobia bacterium]|nr:efflux RND transporter periplasmic adaptor subunit [Verrucomicrobiota bacterium]
MKKLLIAAGLLVAVAVALFLRRPIENQVTVETDKVKRRTIVEAVTATGRIHPAMQVKISPEVSGEIIELPFKEGQPVRKGALVLRIKPDAYLAARNSSEAAQRSAEANWALTQANQSKAELEFGRVKGMFKDRLVSEAAYVEAATGRDVAAAQSSIAKHQADMAKSALVRAEEELTRATIFSPIDGTLVRLNSQVGERIVGTATMAGTEVMTIADLSRMEARVDIAEMDLGAIRAGQTAWLGSESFKEQRFPGVVTEIASIAKDAPASGTTEAVKFEVRIRLREPGSFRPGMTVTAQIETQRRENVLSVPIQSVAARPLRVAGGGAGESRLGEVVFVVAGDKARMKPVKRGISEERFTEIIEGVAEGETVVSGGYKALSRDLQDGLRVRLQP